MERMFKMFDSYFQTLTKTGYLPINISLNLLLLDFIEQVVNDKDYLLISTCEQREKLHKLQKCLTKANCLAL